MMWQLQMLNRFSPLNLKRKVVRGLVCLGLVACYFAATPLYAKTGDRNQRIDIKADKTEYLSKTGVQRLSGNVEITQGTMSIKANEISVYLKDNRLARIEGSGAPIRFEQENDAGEPVVGEANSIDYNAIGGTLVLTGNARLTQPRQELNSGRIVFDLNQQTVKADGGNSGRVSISIQPPKQ